MAKKKLSTMTQAQRDALKPTFMALNTWPNSWLEAAYRHMRAANILRDVYVRGEERKMQRHMRDIELNTHRDGPWTPEGEELEEMLDADLIWDYCLLAGYAIECMLKGYCLASKPELIVNSEVMHKSITNHELVTLASKCDLPLSAEENKMLGFLTNQIVWGKYPGPKDVAGIPSSYPFPLPEHVEAFFNRTYTELYDTSLDE
jgi:hypothetical protein